MVRGVATTTRTRKRGKAEGCVNYLCVGPAHILRTSMVVRRVPSPPKSHEGIKLINLQFCFMLFGPEYG